MTCFIAGAMTSTGILLAGIFTGLKLERGRALTEIRKHLEGEESE